MKTARRDEWRERRRSRPSPAENGDDALAALFAIRAQRRRRREHAEDLAGAVFSRASPKATFVTSQTISSMAASEYFKFKGFLHD